MDKRIIVRIIALICVLCLGTAAYFIWRLSTRQVSTAENPVEVATRYQTSEVHFGDLAETIGVTGAVRSRQSAVLIWQTSGTVKNVNEESGQVVQAQSVLASLERTSLPQVVILAQAELVTAQKNLDTLLSSTQVRANVQMALVKAEKALEDAEKNRRNKLYQRASQETIDIARARLITANDALDKAEAFFDTHNEDPESVTYAAALDQMAKARQLQTQAQYNLNYVTGLPSPLDIEEADAKIAVAEADLLEAKLEWERVKDGPNDQDVAAAEARVAAAQATINLARITAPFGGTLTNVSSKVGDQVTPGSIAFQLDDLSSLYIDAAVDELDIARVQVGQPVLIALDALPGKEFTGKVTEIGAVGKNIAGTVNFSVTVEITSLDPEIKPGMTSAAKIIISQAENSLLVPTSAIRSQNGLWVVYILKGGEPEPVTVLPGPAAGSKTAILDGDIQEGDFVIVNPSGMN